MIQTYLAYRFFWVNGQWKFPACVQCKTDRWRTYTFIYLYHVYLTAPKGLPNNITICI